MPFRKKSSKQDVDPTTQRLIDQGIIKVNSKENEKKSSKEKLKEFGQVTYDFWSGVKYILILSALLWWLPLFGPMLAGYVGGRRTGGPKKGLIAAALSLSIVAGVHFAFTQSLVPTNILALLKMPSSVLAAAYQRPVIAPYARFIELYWSSFFTSVLGGLPYSPNSYLITVIFAYVGGVISIDKKRELQDAEESGSTINIDLSSVTNIPSRSTKNMDRKKSLVHSNFSYTPKRAKSSPQKWEDLKPIQVKQLKNKKKKAQKKKKQQQQEEDSRRYKPVKFSSTPVRHHTNTEGDDWEFL